MRGPDNYNGLAIATNQVLLASTTQTATGTGSAVSLLQGYGNLFFQLDLTAAATDVGDQYRVRWAIVDAGTANASFTFSVTANAT